MLKILSVAAIATAVAVTGIPSMPSTAEAAQYRNCNVQKKKGRNSGALLGAVAGQLIGGNTKSTLIGAGVGAVAGHNVRYNNCKKKNVAQAQASRSYRR